MGQREQMMKAATKQAKREGRVWLAAGLILLAVLLLRTIF